MNVALVDADILCYRVAAAGENDHESSVLESMATVVEDLMLFDLVNSESFEFFLTGKNNFRYDIAKTAPYKGNRKDVKKPRHLPLMREYMINAYGASVSEGQEADDDIAIRATELGTDCVIVSIDKDFLQVPGWHYNFVKRTTVAVSEEEALRNFYTQVLVGDSADNIKGAPGIGKAKAAKLLADLKTEQELYQCCVEAMGADRVLEDARLLWLRRKPNQIWEPPNAKEV